MARPSTIPDYEARFLALVPRLTEILPGMERGQALARALYSRAKAEAGEQPRSDCYADLCAWEDRTVTLSHALGYDEAWDAWNAHFAEIGAITSEFMHLRMTTIEAVVLEGAARHVDGGLGKARPSRPRRNRAGGQAMSASPRLRLATEDGRQVGRLPKGKRLAAEPAMEAARLHRALALIRAEAEQVVAQGETGRKALEAAYLACRGDWPITARALVREAAIECGNAFGAARLVRLCEMAEEGFLCA